MEGEIMRMEIVKEMVVILVSSHLQRSLGPEIGTLLPPLGGWREEKVVDIYIHIYTKDKRKIPKLVNKNITSIFWIDIRTGGRRQGERGRIVGDGLPDPPMPPEPAADGPHPRMQMMTDDR